MERSSQHPQAALAEGPLDLAALRLALHGWWFGQPVVPAPPGRSIEHYTSHLAEHGERTGPVVVTAGLPEPVQAEHPQARAGDGAAVTLIIRPALSFWLGAALTGIAALETASDVPTGCT